MAIPKIEAINRWLERLNKIDDGMLKNDRNKI